MVNEITRFEKITPQTSPNKKLGALVEEVLSKYILLTDVKVVTDRKQHLINLYGEGH